jgi:hypothetical protein
MKNLEELREGRLTVPAKCLRRPGTLVLQRVNVKASYYRG